MPAHWAQHLIAPQKLSSCKFNTRCAPVKHDHDVLIASDLDGLCAQRAYDGGALLLPRGLAAMGGVRPVLETVRPFAAITPASTMARMWCAKYSTATWTQGEAEGPDAGSRRRT